MVLTDIKISSEHIQWIKEYIRNASPSGNEIHGQRMWLDYIKPYIDTHIIDNYGNVVGIINPDAKFKVLVEAHADEIAWYIHTITKDGFLHVEKNGGSDPGIAPSQNVKIHTQQGVVKGIFGWPAIHTRKSAPKEPTPATIFVDCGCSSKEEVESLGIQIGDCVTYDSGFSTMNKNYFVGRGQDNKIGGFMLAMLARLITENDIRPEYGLYITNSVQEEVGLHGAGMVANMIQPDCVFVTDVTHATHTPLVNRNKEGDIELGYGPVITKAPPVHSKLREFIVSTARDENIPHQLAVSSRKTGTDADAFAYTRNGIPTALITLPLRYMHTTVETTHRADIENTIRLLYALTMRMDAHFDFKYF
jgi:putative aminopeptidase FrvX